ncbi:MAG TPA: MgtC/SapB family protein [Gemmatimonadaceae bacterium]|nr:MgtC/SapB family protein [Gemmatimonadaceae bacterium]
MQLSEFEAAGRIAIAMLIGAIVGLEREWSKQTRGPNDRFAGLRTFLMLGLCGGVGGVLVGASSAAAGAVIIAGGVGLTISAYVVATSRPGAVVTATTETAAIVVIGLGALAGIGWPVLAASAGSIVVLALSEKTRLHWLVGRVSEAELHATLQFAVLALVVLPLLPDGPFGGALDIRPRVVWLIALTFSGLSFAAYLFRASLGSQAGYIVTGLAGGLVSSTLVTLEFSRRSRAERNDAGALAYGVIGACTVLMPRVIALSAVLSTAVALRLAQLLWAPAIVGAAATMLGWRYRKPRSDHDSPVELRNPLRFGAAMRMALAFQVAISMIAYVQGHWGITGVFATASVLGLTDVDALTMSMSRLDAGLTAEVAATAIVVGILVNTVMKLGLSVVFGSSEYRRIVVYGLTGLGVATAVALIV